jgi:hypothetical protein
MKKQPSLFVCLILDLIGMSTYTVPFAGELFDAVWAPVSGVLFFILFGRKALFGAAFSFVEELLPGTDIIPTFTIAWLVRSLQNKTAVRL